MTHMDILVRHQRRTVVHYPRPIAAAMGKRPTASVKYWLADTGCGYDLVAKKHVSKFTNKTKQSDNPIMFNTANGNTYATIDILLRAEALDEDVEPYVLDSTPAVLSVRRRFVDFGYAFHWPPGSHKPYFLTPKGKRIELVVQDYVPYVKNEVGQAHRNDCDFQIEARNHSGEPHRATPKSITSSIGRP